MKSKIEQQNGKMLFASLRISFTDSKVTAINTELRFESKKNGLLTSLLRWKT